MGKLFDRAKICPVFTRNKENFKNIYNGSRILSISFCICSHEDILIHFVSMSIISDTEQIDITNTD